MSATLRGTAILATTSPTLTLTLPTGTVAGDTAVFFAAGAWQINTPSGWTVVCTPTNASNWNGAVFTRVLTSGDISTGTATVTFVNTGDAVAAVASSFCRTSDALSLIDGVVQLFIGSVTITCTSTTEVT